jgi:hypothetical protein
MCVRASHSLVPVNNFNGILFLFSLFFPAVIAHLIIFSLSEKMCCAQPIVAARWRRRFYNRTSAALIFSVVTCYFLFLKSNIRSIPRAPIFFLVLYSQCRTSNRSLFSLSHSSYYMYSGGAIFFWKGEKKY